jgi:hypothetical protein
MIHTNGVAVSISLRNDVLLALFLGWPGILSVMRNLHNSRPGPTEHIYSHIMFLAL